MSFRTIMVFPKFENIEIIDNIRKQYDPLVELVKPHITLVFPFESQISNTELSCILDERLHNIKPFELKLGGVIRHEDASGNYLFMSVLQGAKELTNIHQVLYDNEFKEFDAGLQYIPHMTIGKFASIELLNNAFLNVKSIKDTFRTVVDQISVEMIGENGESIIVIEKELI